MGCEGPYKTECDKRVKKSGLILPYQKLYQLVYNPSPFSGLRNWGAKPETDVGDKNIPLSLVCLITDILF